MASILAKTVRRAALAAALGASAFGSAALAGGRPVVVELFTSQGCSSCPPANANLIELSRRPGILALSFGVTYWDQLGWKDIFAREDYTRRQYSYEPGLGHDGPFTPQIVVEGRSDVVGNRLPEIEALIAKGPAAGPNLKLAAGAVSVGAGAAPSGGADVWLVRYDPHVVEVPVKRGENTGRTLPHGNVVHDLTRLGAWSGAAATFAVPPATGGLRTAVLVQSAQGGPILSATTD